MGHPGVPGGAREARAEVRDYQDSARQPETQKGHIIASHLHDLFPCWSHEEYRLRIAHEPSSLTGICVLLQPHSPVTPEQVCGSGTYSLGASDVCRGSIVKIAQDKTEGEHRGVNNN